MKNESIYKIYCVVNKGNDTSRIVALGTQPQTSNEFQTLHKMDDKNMFYLAIIFLSTIQNTCQRLQYNKKNSSGGLTGKFGKRKKIVMRR